MAYAFMSISKIKTIGTLVSKYNHNYRQVDVLNAGPDKISQNEELIPLPTNKAGDQMRYDAVFEKRMSELPYYQSRARRRDQVLGYEVLLAYTRDPNVDVEKWKRQSIDWLRKTFDVAPDNKSNVLGAVFHGDESGNVHIHAFVVPIDERGHLCAKRFTNGSRQMSDLQSSYADAVKDLGLERGQTGSVAEHQKIRMLYADLNGALDGIPSPRKDETAEEYYNRVIDELEMSFAVKTRKSNEHKFKAISAISEYANEQKEAVSAEMERIINLHAYNRAKAKKQEEEAKAKLRESKSKLDEYKEQISSSEDMLRELMQQSYDEKMARVALEDKLNFEKGIKVIARQSPERAERILNDVKEVVDLGAGLHIIDAPHR